jgi:hypothetical protein
MDPAGEGNAMTQPLCFSCPSPAMLRIDEQVLLCSTCWERVALRIKTSNPVTPGGSSSPGVNVTAGEPQPPCAPALAVTSNSGPMLSSLASQTGDVPASSSSLIDVEAEVSALEASNFGAIDIPSFLAPRASDSAIKNSMTFRVTAASDNISKSVSVGA